MIKLADNEEGILQDVLDTLTKRTSAQIIDVLSTQEKQQRLVFPNLEIRLAEQVVYRNDVLVPLSHYEFFTLYYLAQHPGWVFTKEQIYEAVWDEFGKASNASVISVICQIRRKLWPENPRGGYIKTVHNSGYKFEV